MNAEKCCEAFSDAEKYRLKGNQQFLAKPPQYAEAIESYTYSIKCVRTFFASVALLKCIRPTELQAI